VTFINISKTVVPGSLRAEPSHRTGLLSD